MMRSLVLLTLISGAVPLAPDQVTCPEVNHRIDCHPDAGPSEESCQSRGCCWAATKLDQPKVPACFFPENYGGYSIVSNENDTVVVMERTFPSPYPRDVQRLRINVEPITDYIVRVKIADADNGRYETPYPKLVKPAQTANVQPTYKVIFEENSTGFKVVRRDQEERERPLFDSLNIGAFIFADQFLEITTAISGRIFGIGEHRTNLTIEPTWKRLTLFNHDNVPSENNNLYGSHPFYLVAGEDGFSHGVYLHNSNAMDVLISPAPYLTFRTVGGIFDFYFFTGPTPADVVSQYTSLVGNSLIPPYWSLGFHLCRFGYNNASNTRAVWQRNRDLRIPFDTQWNDIDYMTDQNGFTLNQERYGALPDFVRELHDIGMHYVMIVDPGISGSEEPGTYPPYDLALEEDVLVKDKDGNIFTGRVWNPVSTVWPDFTHPNVQSYWNKLTSDFHEQLSFDGIWIDMNEPSNFLDGSTEGCPDDELEHPPYTPGVVGDKLFFRTICMTARQAAGSHYNIHNLYGISESEVTNEALRNLGKRPFVISRSTFSGSGRYTGHWSGDNSANWNDLRKSVQEVLQNNLYGIPLIGADICGFLGDTNQELCNRWYQLGAFYPFSRTHNNQGQVDQDPASFDKRTVDSIRDALAIRYSLLPYLYTLFYLAHIKGETVARPLFFEFLDDPKAYDVETAFLWGPGLYIVPVLEENKESVTTYLPAGRWYDLHTGGAINSIGQDVTLDAPYDKIPLLYRGGVIFPVQGPAVTTELSRKNGISLYVSLNDNNAASGVLFWDDGDVIDPYENDVYGHVTFSASQGKLSSSIVQWKTADTPNITGVALLGAGPVIRVTVNGSPADFKIDDHFLLVRNFCLPVSSPISVEWT